jgi:hypothetical protein
VLARCLHVFGVQLGQMAWLIAEIVSGAPSRLQSVDRENAHIVFERATNFLKNKEVPTVCIEVWSEPLGWQGLVSGRRVCLA